MSGENVFGAFAGALSKLGFLIFLPITLVLIWYGTKHQFETDNAKSKIMGFAKLFFLIFAGLQLPRILVWTLNR